MFQTFRNAWKIDDLRKKILYTLLILMIFRLGSALPSPFVDAVALGSAMQDRSGTIFGFFDLMTGGNFSSAAIFALGPTPYINASIIIQLLQVVIPALERLAKEGEEGRKKLNKITRYVTIGLSLVLSFVYFIMLQGNGVLFYTKEDGFAYYFSAAVIIAGLTAGAMLVMWLADQIDAKGIGNGMSLLIFVGIVAGFASAIAQIIGYIQLAGGTYVDPTTGTAQAAQPWMYVAVPLIVLMFFGMFVLIIVTHSAERRIPVQYAKRVVGRKMYGGQSTNIPVKVNMTGVLPVIFASAFLSLPVTIRDFVPGITETTTPGWWAFLSFFATDNWGYAIFYALLIIAFNYFYVTVQYNPLQMANDLRKNSGMIPGIRPGKSTADFIAKVISKITFIGGIFLVLVATLPIIVTKVSGLNIALGGTSILIVVGVALEITNTLESYMLMRHHKGFLG
jgi:preprotein translocase subunit SecY